MNINPLQLITMLQSGNPEQIAKQIISQNFANDPTMQNLVNMAEKGDTNGIQQFANNYFSARGTDLNTEMNKFMHALGKN